MRSLRWIPAGAAVGVVVTAALMPPVWLITTFGIATVYQWLWILAWTVPLVGGAIAALGLGVRALLDRRYATR